MSVERIIQLRRNRGFTAIELTAVATIISILALILVPIVRNRLESVRRTAAQDDMRSMEIALVLANADVGFYPRLNDLDNAAADLDIYNDITSTPQQKADAVRSIPNTAWNRMLNSSEVANATQLGSVAARWNGPYMTWNKTKFLKMSDIGGLLRCRTFDPSTGLTTGLGPIPIINDSVSAGSDPYDHDVNNLETYPVDPWSGPYIFFGPGRFGPSLGETWLMDQSITESNFGTSVIYSTGPDAIPGAGQVDDVSLYFRETGILGTGDDEWRVF